MEHSVGIALPQRRSVSVRPARRAAVSDCDPAHAVCVYGKHRHRLCVGKSRALAARPGRRFGRALHDRGNRPADGLVASGLRRWIMGRANAVSAGSTTPIRSSLAMAARSLSAGTTMPASTLWRCDRDFGWCQRSSNLCNATTVRSVKSMPEILEVSSIILAKLPGAQLSSQRSGSSIWFDLSYNERVFIVQITPKDGVGVSRPDPTGEMAFCGHDRVFSDLEDALVFIQKEVDLQ